MGRGRGGRGSGSRSDEILVEYDFNLFSFNDEPEDDPEAGRFGIRSTENEITTYTFPLAIEDFTGRFSDDTEFDAFSFDAINIEEPITLNLSARYLVEGDTATLSNGQPIINDFAFSNSNSREPRVLGEGQSRIEYVITDDGLGPIEELALVIIDEDGDPDNGIQISETDDSPFTTIVEASDIEDAISDRQFIVDNVLLDYINSIRISAPSAGDPAVIVSNEGFGLSEESMFSPFPVEDGDVSFEPVFGTLDGDVIEVEGSNQLIFTGDSDDFIDASVGSEGGNQIYAGSGDDTLILGLGDRPVGGEGDDRFFVTSGGDNVITGGEGADQFWIASAEFPDAINLITDFTLDEDVIGIGGLGIDFDDVSLTQQGDDALIGTDGKDLALLQDINTSDLSADDFVFS